MRRYLILPIEDGDPGIIHDALTTLLEPVKGTQTPYERDLLRLRAEIGYYQDRVPLGGQGDGFHITAFCCQNDPRPDDDGC